MRRILLVGVSCAAHAASFTAMAQEGTPSRSSIDCSKYVNCNSAQWGLNKQGYALIAAVSTPQTYMVCMAPNGPPPAQIFQVYVKVDNVTLNYGSGLGAPLVSGGCTVITGKKIEVVYGGAPLQRIQGHYQRLSPALQMTTVYSWMASPSGVAGQPGSVAPVYNGPALTAARVCFGGDDAPTSKFWAHQRNLVVGGKFLTRSDGTTNAVFARHTCIDVEGTDIYAWRDFDGKEEYPVGGSFMFSLP